MKEDFGRTGAGRAGPKEIPIPAMAGVGMKRADEPVPQTCQNAAPSYIHLVTTPLQDTDPAALRQMDASYARMQPEDKLRRVRQLTVTVARLALAGRRMRDPESEYLEHLRQLARQRLGPEIFARVYNGTAEPDGPR